VARVVPPWDLEFTGEKIPCLMCGRAERTKIVGERRDVGVCEACSVHLFWAWRGEVDDADPAVVPDETRGRVECVKVVLSNLRAPSSGRAEPESPSSYELALVFRPDGGIDFPSTDLRADESCEDAALRALAQHGVLSWPSFIEPLYAALSPRGRMARVMVATAYTTWQPDPVGGVRAAPAELGKPQWREWPPWDHARDLRALYLAMGDVWPLRIWKHVAARENRTVGITTCVRRAASEYIFMQQALRAGCRDVDTSAAELLRRNMSEDEKTVDRLLGERERRIIELREQEAREAPAAAPDPGDDAADQLEEVELSSDLGAGEEPSSTGVDDPFADEPPGAT
jgi:hypothetical protein